MTKKIKRKSYTVIALSILVLNLGAVGLAGCAGKDRAPTRVEWFLVEKSPFKSVYVSQGHITAQEIQHMLNTAEKIQYEDYPLNENTNVSLTELSQQQHSESYNDVKSTTIDIPR